MSKSVSEIKRETFTALAKMLEDHWQDAMFVDAISALEEFSTRTLHRGEVIPFDKLTELRRRASFLKTDEGHRMLSRDDWSWHKTQEG